jgi:uncharacterized protein YjfI (DUF2170 family)
MNPIVIFGAISALSSLASVAIILRRLRSNHFAHLEARLDDIAQRLSRLEGRLEK